MLVSRAHRGYNQNCRPASFHSFKSLCFRDTLMICVSIGRGRHKQMIAEHRHLVDQGARLVELRLDYIRRDVNLKRLLADRPCPVIATCRREQDGGKWTGSEQARLILLRSAIADGVDYVDLEEDIAGGIPRFGKTKRIISYHDFRETPENLGEIHARLAAWDPDIVKIATMAHHPHDNARMLDLVRKSSIPTVGLCMGDIGTPSRLLAGRFGAPFTYATFHHERSLAPGQLSYGQMTEIYDYDTINEQTEIYGVIADPIGHSLSPLLHNTAFREMELNKRYLPFRVPREYLDAFMADCHVLGIKGLSVTIPHKEEIIGYLHQVDPGARAIGAVNTVVFRGREAVGYNTDLDAAMRSLQGVLGDMPGDKPLQGRHALVLGAGGVAKAVVYGLRQAEVEVTISSRTLERAKQLATKMGCKAIDWESRHKLKQPHIVVNCSPVGMHPNVDETPYERACMRQGMIVFDTVYNPEQTLLVKEARERGCRVVTGVDMFVRQAAMQSRHFTGREPPVPLMRQVMRRAIGAARDEPGSVETDDKKSG